MSYTKTGMEMYIATENKLKKQKYHTVRTVPKSILENMETEEILTTLTHIMHYH
jgi:hypothetical protein